MRRKSAYIVAIFIIMVIAAVLLSANFFTEFLWFKSMGYLGVFLTTLISRWIIRITCGLIFFMFLYINLIIAGKNLSNSQSFQFQQTVINHPLYQMLSPRWIKTFFFIFSLVMAVIFTAVTSSHWLTVNTFFHSNSFGITDPYSIKI